VGSTRDGQTRDDEAGEAEVEADEAAGSIRLQLTVRELLLW